MAVRAENEGFSVLDDFVCDAIHAPGIPRADPNKQGRNEGIRVIEELVFGGAPGTTVQGESGEKAQNIGENVRCQMLDEFSDDASQARGEARRLVVRTKDECLQELVCRIAGEMAVPQLNLGEVVEKVLAAAGPDIEMRVRKELQEVMQRQGQSFNNGFAG